MLPVPYDNINSGIAKLSAVWGQVDVSGNLTGGSHIVGGLGAVGHSQSPVLCQIEIIVLTKLQ